MQRRATGPSPTTIGYLDSVNPRPPPFGGTSDEDAIPLSSPVAEPAASDVSEAASRVRVLVIEDDEDLRDTVCRFLSAADITTFGLPSSEGLVEQLANHPVDIVVCDVNLPFESGFSILARLRHTTPVGVIMLTARGLEEDRLLALSLGADCYLTKPANLRELEFVIRNLHRRLGTVIDPAGDVDPKAVWTFDAARWALTAPNGRRTPLTSAESRLLGCLIARAGQTVSREDLLAALGRPNLPTYSRNLDVTVSRLRRRIETLCDAKLPVNAARGTGYAFNGQGEVIG